MGAKLSRGWAPLLAAPVALVCLASSASAMIVQPQMAPAEQSSTATSGYCEHPNDSNLWFDFTITTGDEDGPDANDVKRLETTMTDLHGDGEYLNTGAHAVEMKYTFGIFDGEKFVPTSWTFAAGSKMKNGEFAKNKKAADVEALKLEGIWRALDPNRMRTVTCIVELDGPDEE